jgi:phospholipid/cholesterol/gamma-HCH transport system substrate-binding protein
MKAAAREHVIEAGIGLLVVLAAIGFVLFAAGRTGGAGGDTIQVKALFPAANGISVGTDVRVAGLRVGSVAGSQAGDPKLSGRSHAGAGSRRADPRGQQRRDHLRKPAGRQLRVAHPRWLANAPQDGDTILETQGSWDMMGLVGSVINRSKNDAPPPPAEGLGTMEETPKQ